jgi:predicted nucleic acid-binding Zn ribbon protein
VPADPPDRRAGQDGSPADPALDDAGRPAVSPAGRPAEQDRAALAVSALARAKADAAARGSRPAPAEGNFSQRNLTPPSPAAKPHSRRERREDPAPLAAAIDGLISETGWELAVAAGAVFGQWAQIVGPDLAAHTVPDGLADGELTVTADSTAWATQLRLLAADLVRRLNAELGDGAVRRVKVRGPTAAPRRPGEWRVRGGRGLRDTYG